MTGDYTGRWSTYPTSARDSWRSVRCETTSRCSTGGDVGTKGDHSRDTRPGHSPPPQPRGPTEIRHERLSWSRRTLGTLSGRSVARRARRPRSQDLGSGTTVGHGVVTRVVGPTPPASVVGVVCVTSRSDSPDSHGGRERKVWTQGYQRRDRAIGRRRVLP